MRVNLDDLMSGDVLTFTNGFVGCITNQRRLAMVAPNGLLTRTHHMPALEAYCSRHQVSLVENKHGQVLWQFDDNQRLVAEDDAS